MANTSSTSDEPEDVTLFRASIGDDVVPLQPTNQVVHDTPKPPAIPFKSLEDEQQVLLDMFSDAYDPVELQPGDILTYCRTGVQIRVFNKLRRGQYRVAQELDLHGLNTLQARQLLFHFLQQAFPLQGECVRIIHGKGNRSSHKGPVLKAKTNKWLRQHDRVLAFHSARPIDGGTGAVYVLLRRN